ncbi:zinc finger, CCHC-type containing protein [Tanacetum coccineum]|uniref:Zinc finger, CCHC-type containing protein n=1 Tax=Tanacetum coccineum TaxID=301880 RepID=A0ABQ4ZPR1_9ASTR
MESNDAIFDENCFSSIPRPKDIIPDLEESQRDDHSHNVPSEIHKPRKEAIDDEIGSIVENNTWVLSDLPLDKKEWTNYFDTYALVALITTIRLLLALAAAHNLVIHQIDVKTTFLNRDLEEEVYMKQTKGFVMPVDKTKKFLSSRFSMIDMGEADVILGIKIKHENKGLLNTQSHYIEKILKKFNHEDCSPVSTLMDRVEKLKPNISKPVDYLEYSRAIGCLKYVMTSTRPDIAYAFGNMNYGLSYVGYPLVLKAYSDASWLNRVKDSSSTSGWIFLLRGGAISWASKKQTCITSSTIEFEFVALAATGKEAEWLRNLVHEIPIWLKLIAPISI